MKYLGLLFTILLMVSFSVFAQEAAPELGKSIEGLIMALKGNAGPAAIIIAVVQLLKTDYLGNVLGKVNKGLIPLLIVLGGGAVQVLTEVATGKKLAEALINGLFSGGLAIALYEVVVKHFVKKA